jgi:glycosyltransferase involved in cell wall biosynthesis
VHRETSTTDTAGSSQTRVTLGMIVKNEAPVIHRCLASVLPLLDTWVIVDTGSTDGTQDAIVAFFQQTGMPGHLIERPWRDFGHNRSEALALARARTDADYTLMIDADEVLVFEAGFDPRAWKAQLYADLYDVCTEYHAIRYYRGQLTCNRKRFYYSGVLHEDIACHDEVVRRAVNRGFVNTPLQDGARSRNPDKFARDAQQLERALASGPVEDRDRKRYLFYLGQSYGASGQWEQCLAAYQRRAEAGGWNDEVYYSFYQMARMQEMLGYAQRDIFATYMQAFRTDPTRAEPLWALAKLCRLAGRYAQGCLFARRGLRLPAPEPGLFVSLWVYDYALLDEFARCAYGAHFYREAMQAGRQLLAEHKYPAAEHTRIKADYDRAAMMIRNMACRGRRVL